jgi:hypothetical protein
MERMFAADLAASDRIDPGDWERRSPMLRLKEGFSRLWQRLL